MRIRRAPVALLGALTFLTCAPGGEPAAAGTICELPHPRLVVQFHPRADAPFRLDDIDRALSAGVHAIELDLRLRPTDGAVVCSHSRRALEDRPTLAASIDRILGHRGDSGSVQADGLQFFLVLDIKEHSEALYNSIVVTLRRYVESWSTSAAGSRGSPRGITVVVSGGARGLAAGLESGTADSLFLLEGQDYRDRIRNASPAGGRFQWISIQHPGERGRVRALHSGTDPATPGAFNVRAYDCHRRLAECVAAGVDAVNADSDELPLAVTLSPSGSPGPGLSR